MEEREERMHAKKSDGQSTIRLRHMIYGVLFIATAVMLIHIETRLSAAYAPELVLIRPPYEHGAADERASCSAHIVSENGVIENKPLRELESIYDAIDPAVFYATDEKGFQVLETGLVRYHGEFEIEITCTVPGDEETSYMLINNENNRCSIAEGGTVLLC